MLKIRCLVSAAVLAGAVLALAAQPEPGFSLVGLPPAATFSVVRGLTQDGSTATGGSNGPTLGSPGFTWSKVGGRNDFGLQAGMPLFSPAYAISDNGILAGSMTNSSSNNFRAYRWTGSGTLQNLGVLPGFTQSFGSGVSGDGNTVVGRVEVGDLNGQAFRWTPSGGMQGLGWLPGGAISSEASGISRDGKTIVGRNDGVGFVVRPFRWTESMGMQALPNLPNAPAIEAEASAVNADGSVIVGRSLASDGKTHIVRWKDGVIEDLSTGLGLVNSWGISVSDNGNVIGGTYPSGAQMNTAIVWTPDTGAMILAAYLANHGVLVPSDYKLEYVYAVSGDGLTFGGQAVNLTTNIREGFVATIPAPGGLFALMASALVALRHRREI